MQLPIRVAATARRSVASSAAMSSLNEERGGTRFSTIKRAPPFVARDFEGCLGGPEIERRGLNRDQTPSPAARTAICASVSAWGGLSITTRSALRARSSIHWYRAPPRQCRKLEADGLGAEPVLAAVDPGSEAALGDRCQARQPGRPACAHDDDRVRRRASSRRRRRCAVRP